jgi:hypothetical protein
VPVFGDPIGNAPVRRADNGRLKPPDGLADFVHEIFYPALGTRLNAGSVGPRLTSRLDAYRAWRGALVNELADQLVALHGADDESRLAELRAFAVQQTPRIVALEREAEEIRRALIDGGMLRLNADWNRRRKWTLGSARFAGEQAEKEAQFQIVRAAAYYQDGLVPEQRGLLLEAASELQVRARAARPVPAPRRNDSGAMYFSPATVRLRLPKNVRPELLAGIGRYNAEKTALKEELRDAVFDHDRTPPDERAKIFSALAEAQWPRLVELEKLAEEIREELGSAPPATLTAPPHIPPGLLARIEDYNRDRR